MMKAKEVEKIIESCGNCDNFIPTNEYSEENPNNGYCRLDTTYNLPFDYEHKNSDLCDKKLNNQSQWIQRRIYHPNYAYGGINQCPECGRWTYFIHDMNIDDCITENEGFCSYCGFTQVEDY